MDNNEKYEAQTAFELIGNIIEAISDRWQTRSQATEAVKERVLCQIKAIRRKVENTDAATSHQTPPSQTCTTVAPERATQQADDITKIV
jgi:hypothetical protein